MQSYYIQYAPMYPNHARRLIVASNNLVQQDVDCSKENEKSKEQDSKYLQPSWCPSGLSHTQKRMLQRYAQEGSNGATNGGRAKDVSNNKDGVAAKTSGFNIDLSKT